MSHLFAVLPRVALAAFMPLALVGMLSACAAQPGADLPPFGDTVRHMIDTQTYQPGDPVSPTQGDKVAGALESYRQPAAPYPPSTVSMP
ncbi:hypothetical protein [Halomonas salinarum]|uniref:hypothetical protein n=1 Tax=Halomonas salinarum TaxID=1158993 RepID=UPI00143B1350|nr:hypothetical protein [Halomonas salinarum]